MMHLPQHLLLLLLLLLLLVVVVVVVVVVVGTQVQVVQVVGVRRGLGAEEVGQQVAAVDAHGLHGVLQGLSLLLLLLLLRVVVVVVLGRAAAAGH
jgi:hypothetical protein